MRKTKPLENAVIRNGIIYELVKDTTGPDAGSECNRCALREPCKGYDALCVALFDDAQGMRFEEITTYL
jgi:hypothetical protein